MTGAHKDSAHMVNVEELGKFDSLVVADAAAMRSGSAGQVALDACSPGKCSVRNQSEADLCCSGSTRMRVFRLCASALH